MSSPARILVLAIDAANGPLLEQWAADGTLPNIGSLIADGLSGRTRSVEGFFVGSTWPSFYTGSTPARHGFYSLVQLRRGTYEFGHCSRGEFVKREPFWNPLSRAGRRVAILDIPLSEISPGLNGIQTVEWGSHDAVYGFRASPPRLATEIQSRFGTYPLGSSCDANQRSLDDFRAFADKLVSGAQRKTDLTLHFLARGDWDFFMQVFTEAHCAGHQCWHFQDPRHPAYDSDAVARIGNPLRDAYVAIDTAIGKMVGEAGSKGLVMLLVPHGMAYRYGAQFLLREILWRLGAAFPPVPAPPPQGLVPDLVEGLARTWRQLPGPVRRRLKPLRDLIRGRLDDGAALPTIQADPKSSKCFIVDNGLAVGGIRLNLAGREPLGILQPGTAMQAFCDELAKDLLEIVDEQTGRPLIRRVYRTAEIYQGEHLEDLPDLLVEWSDDVPLGSAIVGGGRGATVRAHSPKVGMVEGMNSYGRTGDHRLEGLFVATGPGIPRGRLQRTISIMDFAPTFTRLLGANLEDCDGRPIPELVCATPALSE